MKYVFSFRYFKKQLNDWTRDELLRRLYDLCNEAEEKDKEIERLNKEKDDLDDYNRHLYNENKRLNNIIDELEKYIEENIKVTKQALKFEGLDDFDKKKYSRDITLFEMILDKLEELKGK